MASCRVMRSRSVVPPMPREVNSDSAARWSWTPRAGRAAMSLGSSTLMVRGVFGTEKQHELVAGAAHVACADGHDGVSGTRFAQEELNAVLHGAEIVHVLVAGFTDGVGQGFAGDSRNGLFAGGVDVGQHQDVGLIESATEFVPEVLGSRVPVGLEEDEDTVELAAASCFERGSDFDGVMAVIVDDGDIVDDAFDIKAAADAGELSETFADQVAGHVEIE